MTTPDSDGAVLSREELEALLTSVGEGPEPARRTTRPFGGVPGRQPRPGKLGPLLRALEEFAAEESRVLSTLYQTPIVFSLSDWEELTPAELGTSLLEDDRVGVIDLEPGAHVAYLVVGRALLFGWMTVAFGARPGRLPSAVPPRPFSRIEERFLRRVVQEVVKQLEKTWRLHFPVGAQLRSIEEPEFLAENAREPFLGASFHVEGLGELSRLRVALPPVAFGAAEQEEPLAPRASRDQLRRSLLEAPVQIRVEAGTAELSLGEIARLKPGDLVALERADARALLVRVEECPKFRAQRGSRGGRLAVQITERV